MSRFDPFGWLGSKARMLERDPDQLTIADKKRIARVARRNLNSETALIIGFGGAVLFLVCFLFAPFAAIPIAIWTGMPMAVAALVLAFGSAFTWALLHRQVARPRIEQAQALDGALKYAYEQSKRHDVQRKLGTLKDNV